MGKADLSNEDPKQFKEQVLVILSENFGKLKTKSTRSSLGKGWSVQVTHDVQGEENSSQFEYYPLRKGWIRMALSGSPKSVKKAKPDFEAARKSLKDTRN